MTINHQSPQIWNEIDEQAPDRNDTCEFNAVGLIYNIQDMPRIVEGGSRTQYAREFQLVGNRLKTDMKGEIIQDSNGKFIPQHRISIRCTEWAEHEDLFNELHRGMEYQVQGYLDPWYQYWRPMRNNPNGSTYTLPEPNRMDGIPNPHELLLTEKWHKAMHMFVNFHARINSVETTAIDGERVPPQRNHVWSATFSGRAYHPVQTLKNGIHKIQFLAVADRSYRENITGEDTLMMQHRMPIIVTQQSQDKNKLAKLENGDDVIIEGTLAPRSFYWTPSKTLTEEELAKVTEDPEKHLAYIAGITKVIPEADEKGGRLKPNTIISSPGWSNAQHYYESLILRADTIQTQGGITETIENEEIEEISDELFYGVIGKDPSEIPVRQTKVSQVRKQHDNLSDEEKAAAALELEEINPTEQDQNEAIDV